MTNGTNLQEARPRTWPARPRRGPGSGPSLPHGTSCPLGTLASALKGN